MILDSRHNCLHFHFSPNSNQFWEEIGHMVADGFENNGFQVFRHRGEYSDGWGEKETHVAVGGHEYFHTFLRDSGLIEQIAPHMIALTGEQPGSQWFSANLKTLSLCKECWDITDCGSAALQGRGIKARHLQLGYSDRLLSSHDSKPSKDLDLFFVGSLTHERARRIADFALDHWHLNSHFQLAELEYAKTTEDKIYLPNEERNRLAARSKITLNYHGHLIPFFEWHRALVAMANDSLFLTDPVRGSAPLVGGLHYISASSNLINHLVDFFLKREELRLIITHSAKEFITRSLRMEHCVESFISENYRSEVAENIDQNQIELIQNELKDYVSKTRRQHFPSDFAKSCVVPERNTAKSQSKKNVISKREKIVTRLDNENATMVKGSPYVIERFKAPEAFGQEIKVSVVISLFNYEQTICAALDSLLFSGIDAQDLEIVVVDDGSSDESAEAARQWMQKAPYSSLLITKHFNTGFVSSRNIGIREARGEYIAILDADNVFLPDGIARLYNKAHCSDADACYGIIPCIDESGKGAGLLSAQPWDVRRLLFCPYIDAMALFRKSKILELGLYDTEMFRVGWFGWEDYELWLRLADVQATVAFVPNFIALYRLHSSSMINTTNLFQGEIVGYLQKKYKDLATLHSHTNRLFGALNIK